MLQKLAGRLSLTLSADCHVRTVRGTLDVLLRCTDAMQWCDLADDNPMRMLKPMRKGEAATPTGDAVADEDSTADAAVFERVCSHMLYSQQPADGVGGRTREQLSATLLARPAVFTDAFAEHEQRRGLGGSARLGSTAAHLEGAVSRLAVTVQSAYRRATSESAAGAVVSGQRRRGEAGVSVEELIRRLGDPSGLDKLLSVARLSPAEHARVLEEAGRWCARRGFDQVDDLIGGGVDLEADAALWEEFLLGLKLSSAVLGNRIRRELVRRRTALAERQLSVGPAPSAASKGRRRSSGGGKVGGKVCPIQ